MTSKNLHKKISQLIENNYKITLQLLDHHGTGKKSSEKYDWYYLDTSRSATKITYDYFCEQAFISIQDKCIDIYLSKLDDLLFIRR